MDYCDWKLGRFDKTLVYRGDCRLCQIDIVSPYVIFELILLLIITSLPFVTCHVMFHQSAP